MQVLFLQSLSPLIHKRKGNGKQKDRGEICQRSMENEEQCINANGLASRAYIIKDPKLIKHVDIKIELIEIGKC